jgi:hypothetical protein
MNAPQIFEPVGHCIYCGASDCDLSDEHIVPLGLNGRMILPKSSCAACAKITGKFEGAVQRTILGDIRIRNNLPTRRKKERPSKRTIGVVSPSGAAKTLDVPFVEFPAPYFVYHFGICGNSIGAPPSLDVSQFKASTIHNHEELVAFAEKYKWDKKITTRFLPNEFRRMLAKIAYSLSVALLGPDSFRPVIRDAILKDHCNLPYFVGEDRTGYPMNPIRWHQYGLEVRTAPSGQHKLFAHIHLFCPAATPTYHVFVGELDSPEQFSRVAEKLRDGRNIEITTPVM